MSSTINAMSFYQNCDLATTETIVLPFFKTIHETLEEIGFSEEISHFTLPREFFEELQTQGPQMAFRPGHMLIGLSLYMTTSLGNWALEKAFDYTLEEKLTTTFEKLREILADEQTRIGRASKYCFDIGSWYEPDRVYVLLKVYVNSPERLKDTTQLFRKAQVLVHNRIKITKEVNKVFIFEVTDGVLNEAPQVTDKIPGRQPNDGRQAAR